MGTYLSYIRPAFMKQLRRVVEQGAAVGICLFCLIAELIDIQ
jgi:hypothetical protein